MKIKHFLLIKNQNMAFGAKSYFQPENLSFLGKMLNILATNLN